MEIKKEDLESLSQNNEHIDVELFNDFVRIVKNAYPDSKDDSDFVMEEAYKLYHRHEKGALSEMRERAMPREDYIMCLECNRKLKVLKWHLQKEHWNIGMNESKYRVKYGLPGDIPLVAKSISRKRSAIAFSIQGASGFEAKTKKK